MNHPGRSRAAAPGRTRQRIIEVAERLFAQRGIACVSLREIGLASGQRNHFAVQYHFGTKSELVDAIFQWRMGPINSRRLALIDELERSGRSQDLRALTEALVYPLADTISPGPGSFYARFQVQALAPCGDEPGRFRAMRLPEQEGIRRLWALFDRSLRRVPDALRQQRLLFAARLMVHGLADLEQMPEDLRGPERKAISVCNLIDVITAMLGAEMSSVTRRLVRAASRSGPRIEVRPPASAPD
jgi:AcrR family transcriptional regulator